MSTFNSPTLDDWFRRAWQIPAVRELVRGADTNHADTCEAITGTQSGRRADGLATSEARVAASSSDGQPIRGRLPAANTSGDTCEPRMGAQSRRRVAAKARTSDAPTSTLTLPAANTTAGVPQ